MREHSFPTRRSSELAPEFDRTKLLGQLAGAYRAAPHFAPAYALLERIVRHEDDNVFRYIHHSVTQVCTYLGIGTEIRISSSLPFDNGLKGQDKVLAICTAAGADQYINSIGGTELYARQDFAARGIALRFLKPRPFEYPQFGQAFVPWLSIVDVLMFNPLEAVRACLDHNHDLV